MTVAHIAIPEAKIMELCRRKHIRKLALFGSVPTDRFSNDSDIDVLVEFWPRERVGFFRLADIQNELSRLFEGRAMDLRTPNGPEPAFPRGSCPGRFSRLCRALMPSVLRHMHESF
jgi:predicted nucleotidyltransferase